MPLERLEVVGRLRDAWSRFVPDEIVAFYSLDAEIVPPTGEMFGRIYRGHEGLRRYISEFAADFEVPSFEVEEVIDAGVCVVEIVQVSARGGTAASRCAGESPASTTSEQESSAST
jgi:ketosteroid isomerase-like protein